MEQLSDQLVRDLLNAAPDPTIIINTSGEIAFASSQIKPIFGYEPAELVGLPIETLLPERYREAHLGLRREYLDSPNLRPMGIGLDLHGRRKDGSEFPVEISLSPVQSVEGMLVSSTIRDVTERKEIQNELVEARNEAQDANRAKSAFLAAASHDLRQPLQTLNLLNAVLAKTATDDRTAKAVDRQSDALHAMTDLLNSLLDISKLESGAIKPDITDCGMYAIFARLRSEFELQAEAKGLKLLVDDCEDVVRTDPSLLEQIIQNLVANAIRYTREGLVQLRCLHNNGNVRIEVLDTGIGIPVNEMETMFEEFYQVHREPGQPREGLGLGLSIVQRLAELLEHPLQVESTPGKGTCFSVTVPRGTQQDTAVETLAVRENAPSRALKILLIDDDPAVADATTMFLEMEGHEVMLAATAAEALAIVSARGMPDMIVSDFHLGGGQTGIDAIARLRTDHGQAIPAVLVTGDTSSLIKERIEAIKPCVVMSKPIDADELVSVIQELT